MKNRSRSEESVCILLTGKGDAFLIQHFCPGVDSQNLWYHINMLDLHIHTCLCGHARGEAEEYIEEALKKGLSILGFSDHLPHNHIPPLSPFTHLAMDERTLPHYVEEILTLREKYRGSLEILLGIEADYYPGYEEETVRLLESYPFDYVIGSIHVLGDWLFDSPRFLHEWQRREVNGVYEEYYGVLKKLARTGLFNIVGHFDLPKKFSYRPSNSFEEIITDLARDINRAGMVVELNTSGLRYAAGEIYPSLDIVKILREEGVSITLGSDAHRPVEVGENFDLSINIARSLDFPSLTSFRLKKPVLFSLNDKDL